MSRFKLFAAAASLSGIAGCTLDSVVVLEHPASVAKGETFAMGAVDIILDVGPASQTADSIFRDSIHVGVGLPAGWQVISAKACPATHFRPAKPSVNQLDTNLRNKLLVDTLGACEGRAFALTADPGVKEFLKGRTLKAKASPDSLGPQFNWKVDTVPQWFGFGGRIDVSVPAGDPADTVVVIGGDTSAVKALPVYIYLSLKAPEADASVRLVYFSKTGRLDTSAFSNASNQDRGALVYRPLKVESPVGALARQQALSGRLSLLPATPGLWQIGFPTSAQGLEILSSTGTVLRAWSSQSLAGSRVLTWDGADEAGRPLPNGRYVLRMRGSAGGAARAFALLR